MGFLADFEAAKERPREKSEPITVLVNGSKYDLVFYRADGDVWAASCGENPLRLGSDVDRKYGYNFNAVVLDIAPRTGRVVDDGVETELPAETWREVIPMLTGHEIGLITDAIWALNEYTPQQELERAKKASRAGTRKKSG